MFNDSSAGKRSFRASQGVVSIYNRLCSGHCTILSDLVLANNMAQSSTFYFFVNSAGQLFSNLCPASDNIKVCWSIFSLQIPLGPTAKEIFFFYPIESREPVIQSVLPSFLSPPSTHTILCTRQTHPPLCPASRRLCGRYKLRGVAIKSYNAQHCETLKRSKSYCWWN